MPLYDYDRTINSGLEIFQKTSHAFADIKYWWAVFEKEAAATQASGTDSFDMSYVLW